MFISTLRSKPAENVLLRHVMLIMSLTLAVACSSGPVLKDVVSGPLLQITGVEIYNGLGYPVRDVVILVPSSGEYVSCGNVLPQSSCSTTFPARDYRDTTVQVSWTEQGEPHKTAEFKLEAPETAAEGESAYIRVEVFASGQAGARLVLLSAVTN